MKTCRDCQATLPLEAFYKKGGQRDGRSSYCKPCHVARNQAAERRWAEKNPEAYSARRAEQARRWREKNGASPKRWARSGRDSYLMRTYGISLADYDAMLAAQGGGCAICGRTDSGSAQSAPLRVDHCHESGAVRGLLCDPCNNGIGRLGDTAEALERALNYLRRAS